VTGQFVNGPQDRGLGTADLSALITLVEELRESGEERTS